jgi:hypothetical protein
MFGGLPMLVFSGVLWATFQENLRERTSRVAEIQVRVT